MQPASLAVLFSAASDDSGGGDSGDGNDDATGLREAAASVAAAGLGCGAVLQELVAAASAPGRALTSPSAAAGRRDEMAGWQVHGAPE